MQDSVLSKEDLSNLIYGENSEVKIDESKEKKVILSGGMPNADVEQKSSDGIDLDVMMSNYYKTLEIIKENEAIIKELKELERRRLELESQLVANNALLGMGVSRGSK